MRSKDKPLTIGLKYCGGCKPGYDRVDLVEDLRRRLAGMADFRRYDHPDAVLILAVQGCPTACADLAPLQRLPVFTITRPEKGETFVEYVRNFDGGDPMKLSRDQIRKALKAWNDAWARFDLEGVLALMHEEVVFENWTGGKAVGKTALRKAWQPWFAKKDFRFVEEDLFVDEEDQKVLFRWRLEWPSMEKGHEGRPEIRRGVDVMHFRDGKMIDKLTYSKTTLEIEGRRVVLRG